MRPVPVCGESGCVGGDVEGESVLQDVDAGDVREYVEDFVGEVFRAACEAVHASIGRSFSSSFFFFAFVSGFLVSTLCLECRRK